MSGGDGDGMLQLKLSNVGDGGLWQWPSVLAYTVMHASMKSVYFVLHKYKKCINWFIAYKNFSLLFMSYCPSVCACQMCTSPTASILVLYFFKDVCLTLSCKDM